MDNQPSDEHIDKAYAIAKERYAMLSVDTDIALKTLERIPLSLHCWQGDDVTGFENTGRELGGGIAATGNYPGKARNADELRGDLDQAYKLIPGQHRLNLHALYAETGSARVERNELRPEHFGAWTDWAKANHHGIDFNPSLFSHPRAASGFTLSSYDKGTRKFWIEHCIACRRIGESFGRELGTPCITNIWIPDGYKDTPVNRRTPREFLKQSLDAIFEEKLDRQFNLDAVEGKLFGLGLESYTVGSHEFYLGYAIANHVLPTLDSGHYHPTETISDKISAVLMFADELLLHISRGVRWDSDHVVTFSDDLQAIAQEVVRGGYLNRVHLGLDYFDASINRIAAWVIGARNSLRALLGTLLEPIDQLRMLEMGNDYTARLALLEESKAMPLSSVWDYYCLKQGVPAGMQWMDEVHSYEKNVLVQRK